MSSEWTMWPSIVEVLEYYGFEDIPSRSGWASIRCYFHQDRVKSASVNVALNAFACHSSDAHGVAIKLVMQQGNMDYAQAKQFCQETFGERDQLLREEPGPSEWLPGLPGTRRGGSKKISTGGRSATVLGS